MQKIKISASAYIIHNNDPKRENNRRFISNFLEKYSINVNNTFNQKDINSKKNIFKLKLEIINTKIFYSFYHYLYTINTFPINKINLFFKKILEVIIFTFKTIFSKGEITLKNWKDYKISSIVTSKHINSWQKFIREDKDFLIVCEDDMECLDRSHYSFRLLLSEIYKVRNTYENIFIDLAGGFEPSKVLPLNKSKVVKPFDYLFKGVYTNTACSYLVNKSLIKDWLEILEKRELIRDLPIDSLINELGRSSKIKARSAHNEIPIFRHGSFHQNFKSFQDEKYKNL